jgi:hypothetical protein
MGTDGGGLEAVLIVTDLSLLTLPPISVRLTVVANQKLSNPSRDNCTN